MIRATVEGRHHFLMMHAGEILSASREGKKWMEYQNELWHISIEKFERQVVLGENSYVEESEKLMTQIEDQVPLSRGWRNIEDVVGSLPNVPAYLAGNPVNMRRRVRVDRDNAPLTIFMDLATSAVIPASMVLKRGIALLALTRQLVEHRPVELWVGAGLSGGGTSGTALWRIDTAPLDLARAAFHIADVSMSRLFGYAMCETLVDKHMGGGLDISTHERMLREATGWGDLLYIPWLQRSHSMVENPVGWIKQVLARYTGKGEE